MPNYADPFGRVGAGLGAAGGAAASGGLLQSVGKMLEPLDYARQALWNAPGKLLDGDWKAALPGVLGVLGGAGLAATGLGLPLALAGGSAIGALGQGIGKAVNEERFAAPSADDLVRSLGGDPESAGGMAASFGLGALGDPLTYAGGAFGGKAGHTAGRAVGRDLEQAAVARGPRYPGGSGKLETMRAPPLGLDATFPDRMTQGMVDHRLLSLMSSPYAEQVLGEIPAGSKYLGAGVEASAFRTPEGHVIRLAGGPGSYEVSKMPPGRFQSQQEAIEKIRAGSGDLPAARLNIPEVLQPARDVAVGPYRVEHLNTMEMLPRQAPRDMAMEFNAAKGQIDGRLVGNGYIPEDTHVGNLGRTPGTNTYFVTDGGAVLPRNEFPFNASGPPTPVDAPRSNTIVAQQPGWMKNKILDLLGADKSVQEEIAAKLAAGPTGGVHVPPVDNSLKSWMENVRNLPKVELPPIIDTGRPPGSPMPFDHNQATNPLGKAAAGGRVPVPPLEPLSPQSLQSLMGADLEALPDIGMRVGMQQAQRANRALSMLDQIPPEIRDALVNKANDVNRVVGDMARQRGLNPFNFGVR